ncbi:MAG TPA: aspartate carbamoyltransferase catalytic subunit [Candidatus Ligilactobacillus excrementigallinarum]|uniref:Aspartate carbamoyltransferase n=1 Tax=Candidatus Ligilactobacillus excrementigallinarum TaxID=2838641 RepID=A0A9D2AAF0_9LACO|nr:aspartate carbamoyltransferase catalytic subunit [Candidatus Ligilactobacillus excrementigallinarum]
MKNIALDNFVSVEDLTNEQVIDLIQNAEDFKVGKRNITLKKPVYASNLFFESSTRTHTSFEMAERKLGIQVISFDPEHSSINKGETLYDTLLTLEALGVNFCVVRHSQNEYYNSLINLKEDQHLHMPILNGGDGSGQHPSQCMLDLMTIYEEFGHFDNLKIAIVGDITSSRVARSNMQLLHQLGANIYFAGPDYWYDDKFEKYGKHCKIDEIIDQVDAVMLLRVQHERHDADQNESRFSALEYHEKYGLTNARYKQMQSDAIIMHPGPINRDVELSSNLVEASKSRFVQQMRNGVFMRMAMIEAVLRGNHLGGLE